MIEKIKVGSYSVNADIGGPDGSKVKIVLAHGRHNDMNNRIVKLIFDEFSKAYQTLRFDFSYVGGSGEQALDDGKSMSELEACMERVGGANIVLVGKSYGSYISVKAALAHSDRIRKVICIGYPFNDAEDNSKTSDQLPLLAGIAEKLVFISGSNDPYCKLGRFLGNLPKPSKFYMINGGDHSLRGRNEAITERNMAEMLKIVRDTVDEA